jgi:hypothetical protein
MLEVVSILSLIDRLIDLVKKRSELNREMFNDFVQPAYQSFDVVHTDYIDSLIRYRTRLGDKHFKLDLEHPVFREIELDSMKSEHLRTKLADFRPANASEYLRPFLTAIDFYLRGISVSGERAEFIDRLADKNPPRITEADLEKGLGGKGRFGNQTEKAPFHALSDKSYAIIFADPMREGLREALFGFDAPVPKNDAEEWHMMTSVVLHDPDSPIAENEERRRMLCFSAVDTSIRHFQASYRFVSQEYSALRSKLLSPA